MVRKRQCYKSKPIKDIYLIAILLQKERNTKAYILIPAQEERDLFS